jgi:5-methylcytosine-specific restriction endonuclease McrA
MQQFRIEVSLIKSGKTLDDNQLADDEVSSRLTNPLPTSLSLVPIDESYMSGGYSYFGIYDLSGVSAWDDVASQFVEGVLGLLPDFRIDDRGDDYPRRENRLVVALHLRRERSAELALECKIRDDYRCQICGMKFDELYGNIGYQFAEAHHKVPLSRLTDEVNNSARNLITTCANCHRMLHRMDGHPGDIEKLKKRIRKLGYQARTIG